MTSYLSSTPSFFFCFFEFLSPQGSLYPPHPLRLSVGSTKSHRSAIHNEVDPIFNEFAYFDLTHVSRSQTIKIEVHSGKAIVAECLVPTTFKDQPLDQVVDEWYDLEKVAKDGTVSGSNGQVHLRLYVTKRKETGPVAGHATDAINAKYQFDYASAAFKTGDVILYEGSGVLDICTKLLSGMPYSHAGIVVELPAKYTRNKELYLLEYTRNLDRLHDGFRFAPGIGVHLFPLYLRLHQYPGLKIWHYPLAQPLAADPLANVQEWMWEVHEGVNSFQSELQDIPYPAAIKHFFHTLGWNLTKHTKEVIEVNSAQLVLAALKLGGLHVEQKAKTYYDPTTLLRYPFLGKPHLLREDAPPADDEAASESSAPEDVAAAAVRSFSFLPFFFL